MKLKVFIGAIMLLILAEPVLALNRIVPLQYPNIQSAIDAAQDGDEVVILQSSTPEGTWTGYGNRDLNFSNFTGNTLVVRSNINVSNPNPQVIANTIIDCAGTRYSPHRAFVFGPGDAGKNITITGLTIQNGYWVENIGAVGVIPGLPIDPEDDTSPVRANSGEDASGDSFGGSILCNGASPTIEYCIIKNSVVTGAQGGDGAGGRDGPWIFVPDDPNLEPEEINDGQWGGHGGHGEGNGYGGAIACINGAGPIIRHCTISDNFARGGCGGDGGDGGEAKNDGNDGKESWGGDGGDAGAVSDPCAPAGSGVSIRGSAGDGFGGGLYSDPSSSPIISDCIFRNNVATWGFPGTGGGVGKGDSLDPPAEPGQDGVVMQFWGISGGAAYYDVGSGPNLTRCEFIENKTYGSTDYEALGQVITTYYYNEGGAVYAAGGASVSIDNCSFTQNLGGALYTGSGCITTIESCTFTENSDTDNGGAIFVDEGASTEIHNSTFNDNSAYDNGGALDLKDDAILTNCIFSRNTANSDDDAAGDGGAINADHPGTTLTMTFEDCTFAGGQAYWGGAVHFYDFVATFTDCYFMGNTAYDGGGLDLTDGSITITGGAIKGNTATGITGFGIGGGLICINTSATITDCVLEGNSALGNSLYGGGGAINFFGGDGNQSIIHRVQNCTLAENSTTVNGGAISCNATAYPYIENCTFDKNSADGIGGAIYIDFTSLPDIIHCIFADCTGYAIHDEEEYFGNAIVKYSLFHNNIDPINILSVDNEGNIEGDPMFEAGPFGEHYLNQGLSVAVDAGRDPAQDVWFLSPSQHLGTYTTDPNEFIFNEDSGLVDLGYHYKNQTDPNAVPRFELTVTVVGCDGDDCHGTVEYKAGIDGTNRYYAGSIIQLEAVPNTGYRVGQWAGGTIDDTSKSNINYVVMGSDKTITLQFEQPRTLVVGHVINDETHYTSIQHAIDDAVDGDIIIIQTGEYRPSVWGSSVSRTISFHDKDITLTSTNPDDPDVVAATVLNDYDLYLYDIGPSATIEGITITGGGRVRLYRCDLSIRNCNFTHSHWTTTADKTPDGCAQDGPDAGSIYGGAIAMYDSSPAILNCTFEDLSVTSGNGNNGNNGCPEHPSGGDGGWPGRAYGGAVYCAFSSNPTFVDCLFADCYAAGGMGGNGGSGGGTPPGHGGRGGGWKWPPSVEDDPTWWYWWDGWTYGDKYYVWLRWGYNNYDWETWSQWFDTSAWGSWAEWYADYSASTSSYGQMTPYDAYDDYWEYSGYGGAVYCEYDSSPEFNGCIFENNRSYRALSGIGGSSSNNRWGWPDRHLIIENAGGAVYAANGSNPEFVECLFSNNLADPSVADIPAGEVDPQSPFDGFNDDYYVSYGGAVAHEDNCEPRFTNCEFVNNEACEGGGLYVADSVVTIADCNFIDNKAYHGAGIHSVAVTGTITDSYFNGNMAKFNAAYVADDPLDIGPTVPVLNQGGGYYCFSSLVDIVGSVFTNNYASASGGAIYLGGSDQDLYSTPSLHNCLIAHNMAGRDGGGVSVDWYAEPSITNCTIAHNIVTGGTGEGQGYGGGLYLSYNTNTTVTDSIIWANIGAGGAQIAVGSGDPYNSRPSTLDITYSDIGPAYEPNATIDLSGGSSGQGSGGDVFGGEVLVDAQTIYDEFDAGQDTVKVIVSLTEPVAMRQATDWNDPTSAGAIRAEIAARQDAVLASLSPLDFTLRYRYENLAAFSGEITIDGLNQLLSNPSVAHIEPVRTLHICLAQGIPLMNATAARQMYNGEGLAVAICDTGVDYTHPMLGGGGFPNDKVIGGYDFGDNDDDPMPNGDAAHGTCCAGLAAGDLGETGDYIGGVAHNAKIYALKISYQDTGSATTDAMIAGWDWCVTHKNDDPANPIMVTSTSFGGGRFFSPAEADAFSPAMKAAADNANAIGITVLASSGNNYFTDSLAWPAAISSVISVGAVYDTTDEVIGYSNTAYFLDVLAPSEDAYTLDIAGTAGYDPGDYYPYFNGTSAACPYAAGAVACLQSAALVTRGNYLTAIEVRDLLALTGDPVTDTKVDITKPRVNLGAAINNIAYGPPVYVEDGCTLNGRVFYDFDPNEFTWPADSNNIEEDPLFIGEYFLSQIEAGQLADSPCVNAGSKSAGYLGMDTYTTRTDSGFDANTVDMGYHHAPFEPARYKLTVTPINIDELEGINVSIYPESANGFYNQYTMVRLTVDNLPTGYQVKWTNTDDDTCTGPVNYVTMSSDKEVEVTYLRRYKLTVTTTDVEGLPPIVVTLDPNSPDGYYDQDTRVKLTVNNVPPNARVSWTGTDNDMVTESVNYVTMDSSRIVEVTYVPRYLLTVMPVDEGGLPRLPNPDIEVILDPDSEDGYYDEGTQVIISVITTPPAGYDISWTGTDNDASKNTTNYVTMNSDRMVYVAFLPTPTTTWTVPGDYPTIPIAIAAAGEGDTIIVGTGIYHGSVLVIDKTITLQSSNPDDPDIVGATIIDKAGYYGPSIYFTGNAGPGTVVDGLTFVNGGGGTTDAEDGKQPTDDDPFANRNGGDGYGLEGGGIECAEGSAPTIRNCVVMNAGLYGGNAGNGADADENNPAGRGGWAGWAKGGGIYVARDASPTFRNVTVTGCFAYGGNAGDGGNSFQSDTAYWPPGYGGNWNEEDPLNPGTWLWQTWGYEGDYRYYSGYGGGVYCDKGSRATFIDCTITGNETRGGMSGIGGEFPSGANEEPVISYEIPSYGGGVYCAAGSTTKFINCTIANNTANKPVGERYHLDPYLGHGGGIAFEETASITFVNCNIMENEASIGGGMYWANDRPQIADCNFIDNLAYQGGGLFASRGRATIQDSYFGGNFAGTVPDVDVDAVAGQGAGIYCASITADIFNCRFSGNEAGASGGGIFLTGANPVSPVIANCLLDGNKGGRDGGGISVNWFARPTIANCTLVNNGATGTFFSEIEESGFGGGLYCSYDSNSVVKDSIFWGNYAARSGDQISVASDYNYDPADPCALLSGASKLTILFSDIMGGQNNIQIDDGCELNWGIGNIDADPCFVSDPCFFGDYYLSQTAAGQTVQSPCVDTGSDLAFKICFGDFCLNNFTTRTDSATDADRVDMGYHHPLPARQAGPCAICDLEYDGFIDFGDFANLSAYWLDVCVSEPWCSGFASDHYVEFDELVFFADCWLCSEDGGPVPDPSTWQIEPYAVSDDSISMTATTAYVCWGWGVEYNFANITDPAHNSGWQSSANYTDTGLNPSTEYCYKVQARDKSPNQNQSTFSEEICATTTDTQAPSPVEWAVVPHATGTTSIGMEAVTATDPEGNEPVWYFFQNFTDGSHSSGWQNSTTWTDTGLEPETEYCYRFKVRDSFEPPNESLEWSEERCATTGATNLPPYPDGGAVGDPAAWDPDEVSGWSGHPRAVSGGHYMRADAAVDPEGLGVEYYFTCTTGEVADSGWRSVAVYGDAAREWFTPAPAGTHYCYSVKYRDTSPEQLESAPSSTECVP